MAIPQPLEVIDGPVMAFLVGALLQVAKLIVFVALVRSAEPNLAQVAVVVHAHTDGAVARELKFAVDNLNLVNVIGMLAYDGQCGAAMLVGGGEAHLVAHLALRPSDVVVIHAAELVAEVVVTVTISVPIVFEIVGTALEAFKIGRFVDAMV